MNILLVCGGGASSSFVAQNVQKAAQKAGMDAVVEAIGETELEDYIEDKDIVLIAPHLKYLEADLKETVDYYHVPYMFIENVHYAKMDGDSILKAALDCLG